MTQPAGPVSVNVRVTWPADAYRDAQPVNAFIFSDAGDSFCIAFGFSPPPPNIVEAAANAVDGIIEIAAERPVSFVLPKSVLINFYAELTNHFALHPGNVPPVDEGGAN